MLITGRNLAPAAGSRRAVLWDLDGTRAAATFRVSSLDGLSPDAFERLVRR